MIKNPIISEQAGDPYILKVGDTYYMSASGGGARDEFVMWESKDLQNWSAPKSVLKLADVKWALTMAWAPTMVEKDGYFYMAFCADQQIGIAIADNIYGPYRDLLGRPLIDKRDYGFQTIDPAFFKDDDGRVYFAFGEGKCMLTEIELSATDAKFLGKMICLSDSMYSQCSHLREVFEIAIYNEAPDIVKIGDRYLFTWSIYDVADYRYAVRYAWAEKPMGPYVQPKDFDHDNILLQGKHDITGCGHACVVPYNGEWYIVYGRHRVKKTGGEFGRDMCCEKIQFLDNVHIVAEPTPLSR